MFSQKGYGLNKFPLNQFYFFEKGEIFSSFFKNKGNT